jgi:hypothetical protein
MLLPIRSVSKAKHFALSLACRKDKIALEIIL